MNHSFGTTFIVILLMLFFAITAFSQTESSGPARDSREKLAVLPFLLHGLSSEEGLQLIQRFSSTLGESNRFQVVLADSLRSVQGIGNPRSLADAGKALSVQKVLHVSVVRREKLYVLQIRLVNVSDAALLYAERVDFSGEFTSLLADIVPEQARKLSQARLDAKTPWAKAAFLFGACLGAILWILWHFRRKEAMTSNRGAENVTSTRE